MLNNLIKMLSKNKISCEMLATETNTDCIIFVTSQEMFYSGISKVLALCFESKTTVVK